MLGNAGDGLVFVQVGLRSETPSSNRQTLDGQGPPSIAPGSTMPARSGLSTRIRMPFFLVPGDLLLMSPMYFFNRPAYENMAVTAANGGFIPWQYGIATGIGRFQVVAGRELGVTWYGTLFGDSHMVTPALDVNDDLQFVTHRSIFFDVPLVEYRPYRSFTSNQSSTVLFQLFAGIDVPHGENTSSTTAPAVNLDTIYSLGVRLLFDWRYYP